MFRYLLLILWTRRAGPISRATRGAADRSRKTIIIIGATHAGIVALRRPDLFGGCIAMSGIYDATCFTGGWMNSTWYDNSPVHFLQNMPSDHYYVGMYNQRALIFCVGQGAWEENGIRTLLLMASIFRSKGIHAWCDFWGYDVNHDWDWWKKQIRYFLPKVLDGSAIGK